MSFVAHNVVTRADVAKGTGLAVSLKKLKDGPATMVLTMRPSVAGQFGWVDGDRLEVALGEDEHHGLMRLRKAADGTALVRQREAGAGDGKRGGPYFLISLGFVPQFVDRSEAKRWALFDDLGDGWIEIVLPSWADETGPRMRSERPRMSAGIAALPPPERLPKPEAGRMPGDPPPGRSALAQRGKLEPVLTRGQARARAEREEAPGYASAEAAEWNRRAEDDNRLADLMTVFSLTSSEARLVRALLDGKLKSREALHRATYADEPGGGPEIKIIDVFISKLRKKLKMRMVEIATVHGEGHRMEPPMVARVLVLLGDKGEPSREDDEADLAAMEDDDEPGEGAAA